MHICYGIRSDNSVGALNFHFGQLCRSVDKAVKRAFNARRYHAAAELPLFIYHIERGRRAEIDYDERRTVLIYCGDIVDYSVGADLPGVIH